MDIWTRLPNLDNILKGEDIIPQSVDILYATVVGLVAKASKAEHYDRLLDYSLKLQREFTVYLIKLLFSKDKEKTVNTKTWAKISDTLVVDERVLV